MMGRARNHLGVLLAALLLSLWPAAQGRADYRDYKNYVRLGLGLHQLTGDLDDAGYDPGGYFSIMYGRYLGQFVVFEAGVQSIVSENKLRGISSSGPYIRDDTLGVGSIVATLKGEFPLGPVVFFAGGGLGGYFVALNSEIDDFSSEFEVDEDDSVFGLHVLAGAYYNISDRFYVGIEGLYRWTDDVDIQKSVLSVPITLQGDLNGYVVSVIGAYRF